MLHHPWNYTEILTLFSFTHYLCEIFIKKMVILHRSSCNQAVTILCVQNYTTGCHIASLHDAIMSRAVQHCFVVRAIKLWSAMFDSSRVLLQAADGFLRFFIGFLRFLVLVSFNNDFVLVINKKSLIIFNILSAFGKNVRAKTAAQAGAGTCDFCAGRWRKNLQQSTI